MFKRFDYCWLIEQFSSDEVTVEPNWNFNGKYGDCGKLGPFAGEEVNSMNVRILIQNLRCELEIGESNASTAGVSAVFRAVPSDNLQVSQTRSGLDGMTLAAVWSSSSGQLCMVGCLGHTNRVANGCHSRICVYIPVSSSITQRIMYGSITNIGNETDAFIPLSFYRKMQPWELQKRFGTSHLSYKYTKIKLGSLLLEKSENFNLDSIIKKSILRYPMQEDGNEQDTLSLLSESLTFHVELLDHSL